MTIKEEVLCGTEWDYSEIKEEVSDAIDLTLKKVEELIDDYFDSIYFEKFDELKYYHKLRYKKEMASKFNEIFEFWMKKNEELKQKLRGGE